MSLFSKVSSSYASDAFMQKSSAFELINLANIQPRDKILDLGCGPGHITQLLADKTSGQIVAIDNDASMISEAQKKGPTKNSPITFICESVESYQSNLKFDLIFCNSAFHWIKDKYQALDNIYCHLEKQGRFVLQMPFGRNWCPQLSQIIASLSCQETLSSFISPWSIYDDQNKIEKDFSRFKFKINDIYIKKDVIETTSDFAYRFFASAALVPYTNKNYYSGDIADNFEHQINNEVLQYIQKNSDNNKFLIETNRIYISAGK